MSSPLDVVKADELLANGSAYAGQAERCGTGMASQLAVLPCQGLVMKATLTAPGSCHLASEGCWWLPAWQPALIPPCKQGRC